MNDRHRRPPRLAYRLLHLLSDSNVRNAALGDFEEVFSNLAEEDGVSAANRWYWTQALKSIPSLVTDMIRWKILMLMSYLKVAGRNMVRQKGYTFINVSGLAIGMASCLLILLYVQHELSYDRYNENADSTFRVTFYATFGADEFSSAGAAAPVAQALLSDYPEVLHATRIYVRTPLRVPVRHEQFSSIETRVAYADASLFDVFSIPLIRGNPETALAEPKTIVISRHTSAKYFGGEDPIGRILTLGDGDDYVVTGLFAEIPDNSHFHFDLFASTESIPESRHPGWLNEVSFRTYIVLEDGTDHSAFEAKLQDLIPRYMADYAARYPIHFGLQPLTSIHLRSELREFEPNGDITYVYIFSAIALFILVIAYVNFINLSTARSAGRMKEVGIRKVVGSARSQLMTQFLSESVLLTVLSFALAFGLSALALPAFNTLAGKNLGLGAVLDIPVILPIIACLLIAGMIAGAYPALYLSRGRPISVLSPRQGAGSMRHRLRSGLVVFQFATSIVLIVGATVIDGQMSFIQNRQLGFNREHVVVVQDAQILGGQVESFRDSVLKNPSVVAASVSAFLPVTSRRRQDVLSADGKYEKDGTIMGRWTVDLDYVNTMGLELIEGRDFSRDYPSDSLATIVNESAVTHFEWDDPIGKRLRKLVDTDPLRYRDYTVIGVVKDFHFASLRETIGPIMLHIGPSRDLVSFRIQSDDLAGTLETIKTSWNRLAAGHPFTYTFLDDRFDSMYRAERRIGEIVGIFATLAILIGCLGLFGLAAFTVEQRTKEIAIRKVLGSSTRSIVMLLTKEFTRLILLAAIIAVPAAWYGMNVWLDGFAYRTTITVQTFIITGILTLMIGFLTVSYQAVKAALAEPVESLKCE